MKRSNGQSVSGRRTQFTTLRNSIPDGERFAHARSRQCSPVKLPSYDQVRREIHRLELQPDLVAMREGAKSIPHERESAESFDFLERLQGKEDYPTSLEEHLDWLRRAGLSATCLHLHLHRALIAGKK